MCAECHSTGVRKNYDAANDRFSTSFSEISVGCEGATAKGRGTSIGQRRNRAGGRSAGEDRRKGLLVRLRRTAQCGMADQSGHGKPLPAAWHRPALRKEVETCGLCHARRGGFSEDWTPGKPLSDTHASSRRWRAGSIRRRADAR